MLSQIILAATLLTSALADSPITFINSCNAPVTVGFIGLNNGLANPGTLASGARTTITFNGGFQGDIWTTLDGTGGGYSANTKGFLSLLNGYYAIETSSAAFTVGMSIAPASAPSNGFCATASCTSGTCSGAFPITPFPGSPPLPASTVTTAPAPPLYQCKGTNLAYTITLCPGTTPPPPTNGGVALHPNGNTGKCIDVRGNVQANGTPVQIYDCNGTGAQKWVLNRGSGQVKLAGTNFCLDAGSNPANGIGAKIWTCYDGLFNQQWYFTGDNRIAVTNQGQCLDLTNGNLGNSNQLQTWACGTGNTNQVWTE